MSEQHPIDHYLTLIESFARQAREQYSIARVKRDQANRPQIIHPGGGAAAALNGHAVAGRIGQGPSAQAEAMQHAQQALDVANLTAANAVMAARDVGALLGVKVTIEQGKEQP